MNDLDILDKLKSFLEREVASRIKLELPPEDGEVYGEYKLVNPSVYIGWIPPKGGLEDTEYSIPSIVIMSDGGEDAGNEANINVRLTIGTYDPGITEDTEIKFNSKGYRDLLNVITRIRIALSQQSTIEGFITIEKPVKWGMFSEQFYPYWHGYVEFSIATIPIETNYGKYL